MSTAGETFSDDIRAAHQRKNAAAQIGALPEQEVSTAARKFNAWVRGEGAPGAGKDVHADSIDDASRPDTEPTAASEGFARWAGAVTDDDEDDE